MMKVEYSQCEVLSVKGSMEKGCVAGLSVLVYASVSLRVV